MRAGRWSPSHSARVGRIFRVHYPWHPLFGSEVQELKRERHAAGVFLRVLSAPGEERLIPAWMLDEVSCAHMELGEPRASLPALADLHHMLIGLGFRQGCRESACDSRKENTDDRPSDPDTPATYGPAVAGPRQRRAADPGSELTGPGDKASGKAADRGGGPRSGGGQGR